MRRNWVGFFALIALLACTAPSRAQVFIRAPFVRVAVGQPAWPGGPAPVYVRAPFVQINNGYPAPLVFPPPVVINPAPIVVNPSPAPVIVNPPPAQAPEVLTPPTPVPQVPVQPGASTIQPPPAPVPQVVPNRPMTVDEFAKGFRPAAGKYQVTLLHPRTNAPVTVAFTLPQGNPRVRVTNRLIDFDYGRQEVEIRFLLGGRVEVKYFD